MQKTSDIIWQDTQHQVLFQLLDAIAEEVAPEAVLQQLHFYAESHFSLEEQYMLELEYPGRAEHIQAHDKFRDELRQMMDNPQSHDAVSRQLIATFLREWLSRHIFGVDKKLEQFLLKHRVR